MSFRLTFAFAALAASAPVVAQQSPAAAELPPVPRQQYVAQMDAEFARLDGDGNGILVAEEVATSQRNAAWAVAMQQNQAVFARLDGDRDGMLSPEEFGRLVDPDAFSVDPAP